MESKTTLGVIPENNKRMSSTSQLFKRIDKPAVKRQSSSSQQSRILPMKIKDHSRSSSKQNVSFETYLHKVKSAIKADEAQTTSNYLLSLRKQYDKMSKDIKQQMISINIKRKQTNFMRDKINTQISNSLTTKDKVITLSNELELIQSRQQQAKMNKKTLQQIITRMTNDKLKQKNDYQIKQSTLQKKQTQLKIKQQQFLLYENNIQKLIQQIQKLQKQLNKNNQQRQFKYQNYHNYMQNLQSQQISQQSRTQKTFQLLSVETNDIMDAKNIVLRDVLMTNKVLDKLLECKISQLLNHYQNFQNSYHLIKTQTNISDPLSLTKKFFSYNEILEELTAKIGYYEKKQESLIENNKKLKQIQKQKITKKLQEQRTIHTNLDNFEEQKEKLIQQSFHHQLQCKKIKVWINNILDNLDLSVNPKQNYSSKMLTITSILCKQSKQVNPHQIQTHIIPIYQFKNPQLKKVIKDISLQNQKKRQSQIQEIYDTNLSQNDYIFGERKKVKKNQFLIKTQTTKAFKSQ